MAIQTTTERIDSKLAKVNGTRKVRTLTRADIDVLCQECREGEEGYWSYQNGGTVPSSYDYEAKTTLAFVAKIEGVSYIGLTSVNARTQGTGGAGWTELRGLDYSGEAKQVEKLKAWRDAYKRFLVIIE